MSVEIGNKSSIRVFPIFWSRAWCATVRALVHPRCLFTARRRIIVAFAPALWRSAMSAWQWLARTRFAAEAKQWPVLRPWLTGTVTVARFLGVFAIVAFVFAACALTLCFEVADEIGADESLGQFDSALSAALREHSIDPISRKTKGAPASSSGRPVPELGVVFSFEPARERAHDAEDDHGEDHANRGCSIAP